MPSEAHEQLVQVLLDNPTPADATLADIRGGFDAFLNAQAPVEDVTAESAQLGGVDVEWVTSPASRADRVIFYIHGGGFSMGSPAGYRPFTGRLAREARVRVVAVDYRLSPEHPYPAPLDDVHAAYRALLEQDGVSAEHVAVVSDSGAAALLLPLLARVRDEGGALPAAAVLYCPWSDIAVGPSIAATNDVADPIAAREGMAWFASNYLQDHPATDPVVNIRFGDLRGFPPLLVHGATRDIVYGDALWLAATGREAGVDVTQRTYHGAVHNFQLVAHLPEAAEAVAETVAFVDRHL